MSFLAYKQLSTESRGFAFSDKVVFSIRGDRRYPKSSKHYEAAIYNDIPLQAAKIFSDILCYSQVTFDSAEQSNLKSYLETNGISARLAEEYNDLNKTAEHLADAKAVISNRLHVLLPAMMLGTLPICIGSYSMDAKIFAIYQEMGLNELIYDIDKNDENFDIFLQMVLSNRDHHIVKINSAVLSKVNEIFILMDSIVK